MADVARIGRRTTLEEVEREACAALQEAQARPNIHNILRCADVWRIYSRMMRERFPARPKGGRPAA